MKVEIQSPSRFLSFKNGWISYELVAPTVKAHLARIFQKFNVASRAAAVAAEKGLLGEYYELSAADLADPLNNPPTPIKKIPKPMGPDHQNTMNNTATSALRRNRDASRRAPGFPAAYPRHLQRSQGCGTSVPGYVCDTDRSIEQRLAGLPRELH